MRAASRRLVHNSPAKPKAVGDLVSQRNTVRSWRRVSLRGRPGLGLAWLGFEPVEIAALPTGIHPTVNAALGDAEKGGDFSHGVAFQHPGHGQTPAPLQLLSGSMTPHLVNLPSNAPSAQDFTFLKINRCRRPRATRAANSAGARP